MNYLKVFTDFAGQIEALNDSEVGRLFRAMLSYAENGESPELKGNERFLWGVAKQSIDNQRESYDKLCQINKRIATERHGASRSVTETNEASQDKDKDKDKDIITPPISPSLYFDGELLNAVNDWLTYKTERREKYKPTGLKSLFTQIRKNADEYGEREMSDIIRDSMSGNYQGIVFDRLKRGGSKRGNRPDKADRVASWNIHYD